MQVFLPGRSNRSSHRTEKETRSLNEHVKLKKRGVDLPRRTDGLEPHAGIPRAIHGLIVQPADLVRVQTLPLGLHPKI